MKSPEFEIRMQLLLAKREEHVRKVLHRFECDLEATTERWNLKAPPIDLQYLLEGQTEF